MAERSSYAVVVKVRAILVSVVWLAFVVVLDLPLVMAVAGVVVAVVLAWWEEKKERVAELVEEDEPFEREPTFYDT
jgi:hypothetical protein